jgi:hemolysin D
LITMKKDKKDLEFARGIASVIDRQPTHFYWIFPVVLALLIIAIVSWMILSETDVVSPTQAKIIASKGLHLIQPKETSEIAEVPVKEGDLVNKGDLLVRFAKRELNIELHAILQELNLLKASVYRLQSLMAFADKKNRRPALPEGVPAQILEYQKMLLENQKLSHFSELKSLDIKIDTAKQEINYLKAEIEKLKKIIPHARKKISRLSPLVNENLATQDQYDQYVEDLIIKEEDLKIKWSEVRKLETQVRYNVEEKVLLRNSFKTEVSQQLLDAFQRLEEQKLGYTKVMESVKLKSIYAPIDGTIHNLRIYTVGTVVQSGEVMMQILPSETPLEVEANVLNRDIGFVSEGQRVKFKIDSFPFTKYGYIEGRVKKIERASVQDEKMGDIYPTIIELSSNHIKVDGNLVRLLPGMSGVVDIKTGKRRLIEYIVAPFLRYKDEALKER